MIEGHSSLTSPVDVSLGNGVSNMYNSINSTISKSVSSVNPLILLVFGVIIIFYLIVFSYLGQGSAAPPASPGMKLIEIIMWGLFIFLILINGLQYFFKIDAKAAITNLFGETAEVDIEIQPDQKEVATRGDPLIPSLGVSDKSRKEGKKENKEEGAVNKGIEEIESVALPKTEKEAEREYGKDGKEVFNIPGNTYTYEEAKALCKAYDSELATYNQIENAYKSGAEWCNYGWSDKQMIFYPTQKSTWNKFQQVKGHEHDCGRPGINGGYIRDPTAKYGVNCFGKKPKITTKEQEVMDSATIIPESKEDQEIDKRVDEYKKNLSAILLAPFNYNSWTKY